MRARRDFDLLSRYPHCSFGTTITSLDTELNNKNEPGAASWQGRVRAIEYANSLGIRTWVSLEPVIYPEESIKIVKLLYPIVDHWKVGKLNYYPDYVKGVDFKKFRDRIIKLFKHIDADYYIKRSLMEV